MEVVSEKIPHFWFDVIGRIIPGVFLLGGLAELHSKLEFEIGLTVLVGQSATVVVVGLFLFIAAAYIAGFLLASLSYWLVEYPMDLLNPFQIDEIPESVRGIAERLDRGSRPRSARQFRDFCGNLIWTRPEALQIAVITSKRDAETLASRSLALSSLCLIVANARYQHWHHVAVLLIMLVAGWLSFKHYHERSFSTRFDAAVILLDKAPPSIDPPTSQDAEPTDE